MAELQAEQEAELDDAQAKIDSGSEEVKERCVGKNKLSKPAGPTVQSVYPDGSYAIVIGINDYTSSGVPKDEGGMGNLDSARQDAELVTETLTARGFTIIGKLFDADATKANINELLSKAKDTLKGKTNARFVCFLASHGHHEDGDGWICTYGANTKKLECTCMEMGELKKFAKRLDCAHQLYLLDCCYAGELLVGDRCAPSTFELAMLNSPAIYGMTAVTKDQKACEVGGHGMFTKYLVNGLNGKVTQFENRGHVTARELFDYVQRGVVEFAHSKGKTQTPKFEPLRQMHKDRSCDGQVLFFRPAAVAQGAPAKAVRQQQHQQKE
jgi:uncharacterized caspase-like protein